MRESQSKSDKAASEFATIQDIVWAAKTKLPQDVWDYVTYGTDSETTVRRNRFGLDSLALVPRIMRDVSRIDPKSRLIGKELRIPVVLAPIGSIALLDPDGALSAAEVARDFGILHIMSGYAQPNYDVIGRAVPDMGYAVHPRPGLAPLRDLASAIADAGFGSIALVSEAVFYTRRERDLMSQVRTAFKPQQLYSELLSQSRRDGANRSSDGLDGARMSWSMISDLKSSGLNVILKGVMSPDDARLAVEHGVDAIYVSNHGGRALDHAQSSIEVLPEIVQAVGSSAEVVVDGGFVRGTDIAKALALGASAVAIGKMQAWALAAGGRAGLFRLLELLEEELVIAMALLGVNFISELSPDYVRQVPAIGVVHPLGAFPVVMERLLGASLNRQLQIEQGEIK
ncbi:hypothetical protein GR212_29035 [Rhizobium lusitanum]|uniref:FMN hydroxy acid dehydrogenase domain-containing protein n=1 Tax=Rhizobium lusitanum TaxID=293958 RepID=A0A6L9UGY0_9HYPH|nr:alpha-hydroxy acid oxidase [Rhizobium lusitanum]NEI73602.1 hypothetical protein [Rhizobium lusitanum]